MCASLEHIKNTIKMELKEVKRERKDVTMTIRTSKAKYNWINKNQVSPALLFDKALAELINKTEKEVKN
jgi:hypothetical protein